MPFEPSQSFSFKDLYQQIKDVFTPAGDKPSVGSRSYQPTPPSSTQFQQSPRQQEAAYNRESQLMSSAQDPRYNVNIDRPVPQAGTMAAIKDIWGSASSSPSSSSRAPAAAPQQPQQSSFGAPRVSYGGGGGFSMPNLGPAISLPPATAAAHTPDFQRLGAYDWNNEDPAAHIVSDPVPPPPAFERDTEKYAKLTGKQGGN